MTATLTATPPAALAARRRPSRWTVVVTAVAVAAVLSPAAWLVSRPDRDAGVAIEQALAGPSEQAPPAVFSPRPGAGDTTATGDTQARAAGDDDASAGPPPFGTVTVRDASPDADPAPADPAPARLVVDGLDLVADVDAVGVEDDGSMVVPAEIDRVGWYRFGAAAGAAQGHAVLAGHVDAAGEGPGALFDLRGVEVGTIMTVDDIFARDGGHRLVVVTCGGPFIPELSSYRDNVVVTAVPVDEA